MEREQVSQIWRVFKDIEDLEPIPKPIQAPWHETLEHRTELVYGIETRTPALPFQWAHRVLG